MAISSRAKEDKHFYSENEKIYRHENET